MPVQRGHRQQGKAIETPPVPSPTSIDLTHICIPEMRSTRSSAPGDMVLGLDDGVWADAGRRVTDMIIPNICILPFAEAIRSRREGWKLPPGSDGQKDLQSSSLEDTARRHGFGTSLPPRV